LPSDPTARLVAARRKLEPLRPYLPAARDALIVDMGRGPGLLALALRELGYTRVISFDSDIGQVENGRRFGVDVQWVGVEDTARFLDALRGQVSLFLLVDVLEHIPPVVQKETLETIRQTLVADGQLLCQVPNADSPVAMRYRYGDWTHHCSFTVESLQFVLSESGFEVGGIVESPAHRLAAFGVSPRGLAWFGLASLVRGMTRIKMLPFLGRRIAMSAPLSANILAAATLTIQSADRISQ
jgi:SAM-dependent methyltransferase